MKIELHVLKFGTTTDWMRTCAPTLEAWAARHQIPVTTWDDSVAKEKGYPSPKFAEKGMLEAFLKGDADFMIYADLDIWVHPEAPLPPLEPGLSMATDCYHAEHQPHWQQWCSENINIERAEFVYSNAGVWIIDRASASYLLEAMEAIPMVEFFQDQHWFCACAAHALALGMNFNRLPSEWNRFGRDHEPAWFRHFWSSTKMADYEECRSSGMLDTAPDGLRYSWHPGHTPYQDRVLYLQFVKNCGLGNQMFELAAGIAMAKELGIPLRWQYQDTGYREFDLAHFGFGKLPFRQVPVVSARLGQGNAEIFDKALHAVTDTQHPVCAVSHPFQAEECFAPAAAEVRELFKLEPYPLEIPEGRTPVGVQVRRGDYVQHARLDVVTPEYFLNGIDFIRQRINHPHFFIVSDDPEWCKVNLGHLPDVTVMPPQTAIEGLRTLVSCEAHVISNSTFGWWGAWLVDKLVVVPEIWHHKPGSYGKWNPVPDRWHKVAIGRPLTRKPVVSQPPPPVNFREFPRQFERAVVIPWHAKADRWESLRYCLRSIHRHFTDSSCPIVILGTKRPGWLLWKSGRVRFIETHSYEEALMHGVQIASEVVWMNDDIKFLQDTGWEDLRRPIYFDKPIEEYVAEFLATPNPWRDNFRRTVEKLAAASCEAVRNFSTHVPYLYRMEQAVETLKAFGVCHKMPFETLYFNIHSAGARPLNGERAETCPFGEARFLNYTDHRLTDELKRAIMHHFPAPAPWELKPRLEGGF